MTQVSDDAEELVVSDLLAHELEQRKRQNLTVGEFVEVLVRQGSTREAAIAVLHREIAMGHVLLTSGFMVAPSH